MSIIMWVFFYRHFAPSLSSKVSLKCVFKLMNVAVTLTQKKKLVVLVYFDRLFEEEEKNPVCSGVNLNCPRGAVSSKKSFYVLSHCQGDKKH